MQKMIGIIQKHQYISFDVFDTLIRRSVAIPSDIFRLMEVYIANTLPDVPKDFANKRMRAEQLCREKTGKPTTLEGIYDVLRSEYGAWTERLKELEIRMELDGCQADVEGAALFHHCVEEGKTVLLISDMYLSSEIIAQMLAKCGIQGYEKLYVSCEVGKTKTDGDLYRHVLADWGIQPSELVHIGDNWRSDFAVPVGLGIRVRHIRNDWEKRCRGPKDLKPEVALQYRTLSACIENCSSDKSEYERQGVQIFGPLLLGFTQWLAQRLRQDGITDVFFMARDGFTMKQAFDILEPSDFCTHYLYCSRRSYVVPMLWKHSAMEDVMRAYNWTEKTNMKLRWFLLKVGLEPERYEQRVVEFGLELDRFYTKGAFFKDPAILAFYETVREEVECNSHQEYEALLAYIRSCDMHGTIAVVDIGYHGTMQQALVELVKEAGLNVQIQGYYVGVCPSAPLIREGRIDAYGYLYSVGHDEECFYRYSKFVGIFETLFLGPHGTVKRFEKCCGNGRPVLEEYEYDSDTGRLIDEKLIIRGYQSGAIKLVEYVQRTLRQAMPALEPAAAIQNLMRLGLSPTLQEASMWGDFRFFNNGILYIAHPQKRSFYLLHPKQFIRDFMALGWHIGFLKRLFVLPLPYEALVKIMRGFYHKDDKK